MPTLTTPHSRCSDTRAPAGFSLVEMLVAMVLVSLIMIVALNAFDGSRRITRKNISVNEAQQQGSYALQEMAVTLRRAGFQLGPKYAILQNMGRGGVIIKASWDNYSGGATPAGANWIFGTEGGAACTITGAAGQTCWVPVADTDGITIKYGDDQPPIHVCVMPSASANTMDTSYDPALAAYYPKPGDVIDVITTSTCTPTGGGPGTNLMTVAVNNTQFITNCSNAGGGGQTCLSNPDTCYCKDPLCKNLQLSKNCFSITFDASLKPGCDFCEKGPSYVVASRSATFWISTEDRTGVIYTAAGAVKSRPVLVGRYGLTSASRIVTNDIEDLQIAYLLNNNNLLDERAGLPGTNTDLPKTRALRVSLSARTGVTDLMVKNYAYCDGKFASNPGFTQLFSRPGLENHPATANGTTNSDYCDGLRRVVYNQVINLPNMTAFPIGKAGTT